LTFLNWDVLSDFFQGGKAGKRVFREIADGKHGNVYTTDYVLMKVLDRLTVGGNREKGLSLLTTLYGSLEEKPQLTDKVSVLKVQGQNVEEARRWFFQNQMNIELDLLDWSTISLMKDKNDVALLTFDSNFDALRDIRDETLPQINRIPIKRPRQYIGLKWLFATGLLSLTLIAALALFSGFQHVEIPNVVYYLLAVLAAMFIFASAFGTKVAQQALKRFLR
jgi:predicted nucleic acid-binding protein